MAMRVLLLSLIRALSGKKCLLAGCIMIGLLMCGCSIKKNDRAADDRITTESIPFVEEAEVPEYESCSFADGLDRFIECYNICCTAYGNTNLLRQHRAIP